jgi:hypothetical protein
MSSMLDKLLDALYRAMSRVLPATGKRGSTNTGCAKNAPRASMLRRAGQPAGNIRIMRGVLYEYPLHAAVYRFQVRRRENTSPGIRILYATAAGLARGRVVPVPLSARRQRVNAV